MSKDDLSLYVNSLLQEELGCHSEDKKITSSEAEKIAEKIGKKLSSRIYKNLISVDEKSKKK